MPDSLAHKPLLAWYGDHARDLPWRRTGASPWDILVSEVMLQQTPVARVLPVYAAWLARWPTPAALADERPGEAVRMWGRLGYPRRALRLHSAATVIDAEYGGHVPRTLVALRSLPGVGRLHRGRGAGLRVPGTRRGPRHERPTGPRPTGGRRRRTPIGDHHTGAPDRGTDPARRFGDGCHLERCRHGARCARLHCAHAGLLAVPGDRPLCVARRRIPRAPGSPAQGPDLLRHRPAVPGPDPRRAAQRGRPPWPTMRSRSSGRTPRNANAPSPPCSTTVSSYGWARAGSRCPSRPARCSG